MNLELLQLVLGELTLEDMYEILSEEKKQDVNRVVLKHDILKKYFPKSYTPRQMEETIIKLLEEWKKKRIIKRWRDYCSPSSVRSNFCGWNSHSLTSFKLKIIILCASVCNANAMQKNTLHLRCVYHMIKMK